MFLGYLGSLHATWENLTAMTATWIAGFAAVAHPRLTLPFAS